VVQTSITQSLLLVTQLVQLKVTTGSLKTHGALPGVKVDTFESEWQQELEFAASTSKWNTQMLSYQRDSKISTVTSI
jgi:hypothetical protein